MKKIVSIFLLAGLLIIEYRTGIGLNKTLLEENVIESEMSEVQDEPEITRQPVEYRYMEYLGPRGFLDGEDTIFWQDFYDSYSIGLLRGVEYHIPICIQDSLQDYFSLRNPDEMPWAPKDIYCMFYDNRTIEMEEEELEILFLQNGYELSICQGECKGYQVRFLQYRQKDSHLLYPEHIIMQTWDDWYIYVQEITGPMQRKVMDFISVDDRERPLIIVHTTSITRDYVSEEELSFWEFNGNFWSLVPVELEIEYTEYVLGREPELGKVEDLNMICYPDGIAFRPTIQFSSSGGVIFYLKEDQIEEIERNKSFQFTMFQKSLDLIDLVVPDEMGYVKFEIK